MPYYDEIISCDLNQLASKDVLTNIAGTVVLKLLVTGQAANYLKPKKIEGGGVIFSWIRNG